MADNGTRGGASTRRKSDLRGKARRVAAALERRYASPRHGNKDDPVDELVYIILSQMTTHPSYDRVYQKLKEECPEWECVLEMQPSEFQALIKEAGLSRQKAPRIRAILSTLKQDFGSISLDHLEALDDRAAEEYLVSLPGVGEKTAKCILMYSLGRPVLPVDTHVWRVARRLGLTEEVSPTRIHSALADIVPPELRYSLHVNSVAHGRQTCLALNPRCGACALHRMCEERRKESGHSNSRPITTERRRRQQRIRGD